MSHNSATSPILSHNGGLGASMAGSSTTQTTREKYPAVTSPTGYDHNYPEAVPQSQPSLEAYHQQQNASYSQQQPYPQHGYPPEAGPGIQQRQTKRNPWGLSPLAFGLLIGTVTALVVGGAVGGGVAGAMSGNDNDSSSSSSSATTTVTKTVSVGSAATGTALPSPNSLQKYAPPEAYYIDTLEPYTCDGDAASMSTPFGKSYALSCGTNWGNNQPSAQDSSKLVADITGILAYSLTDCLYACSNMIHFAGAWGFEETCVGVTWSFDMGASNSSNSANCWLKNGTTETGYQCNTCVSAELLT